MNQTSAFATTATPGAAPTNDPGGDTPLRILIIEDSEDVAESLAELLRLLGHEVSVAADGKAGLAMADAERPQVVLCDLTLPGMSGLEVATRLRAAPTTQTSTLVALTGWSGSEDRRRTREAGFDHHMIKPLDIDALCALLRNIGTPGTPGSPEAHQAGASSR